MWKWNAARRLHWPRLTRVSINRGRTAFTGSQYGISHRGAFDANCRCMRALLTELIKLSSLRPHCGGNVRITWTRPDPCCCSRPLSSSPRRLQGSSQPPTCPLQPLIYLLAILTPSRVASLNTILIYFNLCSIYLKENAPSISTARDYSHRYPHRPSSRSDWRNGHTWQYSYGKYL
jgi:hypothetical protein